LQSQGVGGRAGLTVEASEPLYFARRHVRHVDAITTIRLWD
jgi:hypothetical protein